MYQSFKTTVFATFGILLITLFISHEATSFSTNGLTAGRPPSRGLIESAFGQAYREINTSRQYADAVIRRPLIVEESNFEKRMRTMLEEQKVAKKTAATQQVNKIPTSVIQQVLSLEEYKSVVMEETDKIVVVRFHAPWCRACKAMKPSFEKFARDNADTFKFVECPMTSVNTEVHKELGIQTIPFAHVYHPSAGLVEQRRISRPHFSTFEKLMKDYTKGECWINDNDDNNEYAIDPYPHFPVESREFQEA